MNEVLKRLDGETEKHFIWRVYKFRDDTGEIKNKQCGEICNRELKVDYDESRHRKIYEDFEKVWREVQHEYTDKSLLKRLEQIDEREDELYKTKVKTWDVLREKRKLLRDESRVEAILDFIIDIAKNMPEYKFQPKETQLNGSDTAILQLSDWHMGETFENYWGKFNPDILKNRVDDLIHKTIKYCQDKDIGTLYVCCLGDMINGLIHVTSRIADNIDAIEQTMYVSELMMYLLHTLNEYGLNIKYMSTLDNHSRLNKNFKENIEKESFMKLMDWWLKGRILGNPKYKNIEIISNIIDDNIGYFEFDNKVFYCVHGHLENPKTVIEDLSMSVGIKADYVLMGHFHSFNINEKYFSKTIINGSLSGVGEYAKNKRLFSSPSQNLIMFDGNDDIIVNMKFK